MRSAWFEAESIFPSPNVGRKAFYINHLIAGKINESVDHWSIHFQIILVFGFVSTDLLDLLSFLSPEGFLVYSVCVCVCISFVFATADANANANADNSKNWIRLHFCLYFRHQTVKKILSNVFKYFEHFSIEWYKICWKILTF